MADLRDRGGLYDPRPTAGNGAFPSRGALAGEGGP